MQQPPLYSQRMGAVSWQEPPDSARPDRGGQSLLTRMASRCSFRHAVSNEIFNYGTGCVYDSR